jgi:hypothetical protein
MKRLLVGVGMLLTGPAMATWVPYDLRLSCSYDHFTDEKGIRKAFGGFVILSMRFVEDNVSGDASDCPPNHLAGMRSEKQFNLTCSKEHRPGMVSKFEYHVDRITGKSTTLESVGT